MSEFLIYGGVAALAAYLLGSLNGALLMSRLLLGDDIRKHGSGNAGATNVLRTYGVKWTVLVSVWDVGKGVLAVLLGNRLIPEEYRGGLIVAFFVVLGHVFPLFFGFRGGKGVFTSCAVIAALDPVTAAIALGLFFIVVILTRYVSLGSICAVLILPVLGLLFDRGWPAIVMYSATAVLVTLLHRANIKRLFNGTENKFRKKAP
jgi:glycerol-3-phosphate acyltransferase PlsY